MEQVGRGKMRPWTQTGGRQRAQRRNGGGDSSTTWAGRMVAVAAIISRHGAVMGCESDGDCDGLALCTEWRMREGLPIGFWRG